MCNMLKLTKILIISNRIYLFLLIYDESWKLNIFLVDADWPRDRTELPCDREHPIHSVSDFCYLKNLGKDNFGGFDRSAVLSSKAHKFDLLCKLSLLNFQSHS